MLMMKTNKERNEEKKLKHNDEIEYLNDEMQEVKKTS